MKIKVREKKAGDGAWYCFAADGDQRKAKLCGDEKTAQAQAKKWNALVTLGQGESIFFQRVVKAAPVVAPAFPTLRVAVEGWIAGREAAVLAGKEGLRGSTPKSYRGACSKWLFPSVGDLPIDTISRKQLGAVFAEMKGKSISLIEHVRNPLRGMYAEQVHLENLPVSPAANLKDFIGKVARGKRHKFFTEQDSKKIIEAARVMYPRWAAFIETSFKTGLRVGEVTALYKTDVDFKMDQITVKQSWSPKTGTLQPCKNGEPRDVVLTDGLAKALKAQIEMVGLDGQAGEWRAEEKRLLFPTERGAFWNENQRHGVWRNLLKKAGVAYLSIHHARHTFATLHLKNGADPQWVQKQMGHATIGQTLDTYGHHIPKDARHAANAAKLDALLDC